VSTRRKPNLGRLEWIGVLFALVGVFAGLYASYPRPWRKEPVFTSPRQAVGYELARQWARTGKPVETLPLFDQVPKDIAPAFTPRDAASRDGKVVPKDFPLVVAMFAAAHKLNSNVVPFVEPLTGVLALIVFALLAWELTRSRASVWIAAILFASTTSFSNSSSWIYAPDTPAVCVVLLAVYAFVRAIRSRNLRWDVLGGLATAAAFGFRYDNAVIVGVLWFAFLLADRGSWRRRLIVPAVAVLGSIPFLLFNTWLYGSPRKTGYGLAYTLIRQTANIKGRGLLGISTSIFERQVHIYLLRPEILALIVVGLAGIVVVLRREREPVVTAAGWGTIAITLLIVAYAGTRNLTGANAFTVSSSFLRYLLPSFALLAIFAGAAIANRSKVIQAIAFVVACCIATGAVFTTAFATNGIKQTRHDVGLGRLTASAVFNNTPKNAIIITELASKVLWPNRQVLSTAFLVKNKRPVTVADETKVWSVKPSVGRLTDVVVRLVAQHHVVYLLDDQRWLSIIQIADLQSRLATAHVRTVQVSSGYVNLYRFDPE
jgi:4-amino-4-deoxy-L-arabinose transferase and related glycosyltransferases of PMT family